MPRESKMSLSDEKQSLLVLGASGKLGHLLRRVWAVDPPVGLEIHWQFRSLPKDTPPGPGNIVWSPGQPWPQNAPRPGAILALWGVTHGPQTNAQDLAENTDLARAAMDLAAEIGATRVLHCSTAAVYEPGPAPLTEDAAGGAINPYGAAKLTMEQAIATRSTPVDNIIARIGNVAGADGLFAALRRGGPITLDRFADGAGPSRSYVSPQALGHAFLALLSTEPGPHPLTVNLASNGTIAMADIVRAAGRDVIWRDAPSGASQTVWLSTTRLNRITPMPDETAADLIQALNALEHDQK